MLCVELAVEVDPEDRRLALPYLQLEVERGSQRVLLDSGAARSCLVAPKDRDTWSVASSGAGLFGVAGSGTARRWKARLALAGVELGVFEVDEPDDGGQQLIGQDVLAQHHCHYRLSAHRLVLDGPSIPDLPDAGPSESIQLGENGHVYLEAAWPGEQPAAGVLDTGASITVVDASWAAAHPELLTPAGSSMGTDASGTKLETPIVELAGPTILGHVFAPSIAAIVDLEGANRTISRRMDLIMGWPLLSQVDWIIDHPGGLAAVSATRSATSG